MAFEFDKMSINGTIINAKDLEGRELIQNVKNTADVAQETAETTAETVNTALIDLSALSGTVDTMTETLTTGISDINNKLKYVYKAYSTSGAINSLVINAILPELLLTNSRVIITGSWTTHSDGYTAFGFRTPYSQTADRLAGIVIAHDGNVWTFSANSTNLANPVIKQIASA